MCVLRGLGYPMDTMFFVVLLLLLLILLTTRVVLANNHAFGLDAARRKRLAAATKPASRFGAKIIPEYFALLSPLIFALLVLPLLRSAIEERS